MKRILLKLSGEALAGAEKKDLTRQRLLLLQNRSVRLRKKEHRLVL